MCRRAFVQEARDSEKQRIGTEITELMSRVTVEAREIHYDKLGTCHAPSQSLHDCTVAGPGGTKQLSGVTTRLLVHPPPVKQLKRSRKAKGAPKSCTEPPQSVLQVIWTAFYE